MIDALDELAANIMEDASRTTERMRHLAKAAKWDTDEALKRLSQMFLDIAAKHRQASQS